MNGRVASLLEVGTGFHPELSGRENVFLNGAILGMTKSEIRRQFDDIVSFAEVQRFIDTPVKRSPPSGMAYVRLAFAVAAHLQPEILIVDEVLAVGDGAFQQKCLGAMRDVARRGRTVLFVISHNMPSVRTLCRHAIILESGNVKAAGDAKEIVDSYVSSLEAHSEGLDRCWEDVSTAPGNEKVRLMRVRMTSPDEREAEQFGTENNIAIEVQFWNGTDDTAIIANLVVYTSDGVAVFETFSTETDNRRPVDGVRGMYRCVCTIPANLLNGGTFRLDVMFLDDMARTLFNERQALFFTIQDRTNRDLPFFGPRQGVIRPKLHWQVECLSRPREVRQTP